MPGSYEYTQAADPIASGATPPIPHAEFPASLHQEGPSRVDPARPQPPAQAARAADQPGPLRPLHPDPARRVRRDPAQRLLRALLRAPGAGPDPVRRPDDPLVQGRHPDPPRRRRGHDHRANDDAALYWVNDEPLLRYLGARAAEPTFRPTLFRAEETLAELARAAADPEAANRSRVSVLLANRACDQTLTITPTLWAMLGLLPIGAVQLPHRHQSVRST